MRHALQLSSSTKDLIKIARTDTCYDAPALVDDRGITIRESCRPALISFSATVGRPYSSYILVSFVAG